VSSFFAGRRGSTTRACAKRLREHPGRCTTGRCTPGWARHERAREAGRPDSAEDVVSGHSARRAAQALSETRSSTPRRPNRARPCPTAASIAGRNAPLVALTPVEEDDPPAASKLRTYRSTRRRWSPTIYFPSFGFDLTVAAAAAAGGQWRPPRTDPAGVGSSSSKEAPRRTALRLRREIRTRGSSCWNESRLGPACRW